MAKRAFPDAPPAQALDRNDLDPDPIRQFATWFRPVLAREVDATAMTLATADDDGVPWVSPVEFACDEDLRFTGSRRSIRQLPAPPGG